MADEEQTNEVEDGQLITETQEPEAELTEKPDEETSSEAQAEPKEAEDALGPLKAQLESSQREAEHWKSQYQSNQRNLSERDRQSSKLTRRIDQQGEILGKLIQAYGKANPSMDGEENHFNNLAGEIAQMNQALAGTEQREADQEYNNRYKQVGNELEAIIARSGVKMGNYQNDPDLVEVAKLMQYGLFDNAKTYLGNAIRARAATAIPAASKEDEEKRIDELAEKKARKTLNDTGAFNESTNGPKGSSPNDADIIAKMATGQRVDYKKGAQALEDLEGPLVSQ